MAFEVPGDLVYIFGFDWEIRARNDIESHFSITSIGHCIIVKRHLVEALIVASMWEMPLFIGSEFTYIEQVDHIHKTSSGMVNLRCVIVNF